MSCVNYNCDELNDHAPVDCEAFVNGGLKNLIFLECGHEIIDPSNATQITTAINNGTAYIVKNISADIPLRSPINQDSPVACEPQRTINYDNTINVTDANITSNNIEFYQTVFGGHKFGGLIIHECDAEKVSWVDATVVFEGGLIKPKSNSELQTFQYVGKWRTKDIPTLHALPANIF